MAAGLITGAAAPALAAQHTTDNRTNDNRVTDSYPKGGVHPTDSYPKGDAHPADGAWPTDQWPDSSGGGSRPV